MTWCGRKILQIIFIGQYLYKLSLQVEDSEQNLQKKTDFTEQIRLSFELEIYYASLTFFPANGNERDLPLWATFFFLVKRYNKTKASRTKRRPTPPAIPPMIAFLLLDPPE